MGTPPEESIKGFLAGPKLLRRAIPGRPAARLRALGLVLAMLAVTPIASGAIGTATVCEVNASGSDTANGGGFDTGATFATDLAATVATGSAPVVTSASYTFVAGDVGAYLFVKSGTNWSPGFYAIASVSAGAATLTATAGSAVLFNGATPVNTAAGCATTASPTAGTWGIDYSRGTSPLYSYADLVIDGTTNTKFTSAAHPVGPNVVGNFIKVTAGTGFTVQTIEILSTSGTTATCDKSLGTLSSTGGAGGLGGALASPGAAETLLSTTNGTIAVKGSATYTFSSTANGAGGRVSVTSGNRTIFGYTATRCPFNTDANRPVFQSNANSIDIISFGQPSCSVHSIDFENGNGNTAVTGIHDNGGWNNIGVWNCKFKGISIGANLNSTSLVDDCLFDSCTSGTTALNAGTTNTVVKNSVFVNNTTVNIAATTVSGCVFYANGGSTNGITACRNVDRCLFYGTTGLNAVCAGGSCISVSNCIFYSNASSGCKAISITGSDNTIEITNCAFGANTNDIVTGSTLPGFRVLGRVTLTGDPCTNAAAGDFSLNSTAGAGAAARAVGFPTTFPNGLTTNGLDLGPVQTPAGGGNGGFRPRPRTSFNLIPGQRPAAPRVLPAASDREWRKAG